MKITNSKRLHVHAIPVMLLLLAFMGVTVGIYLSGAKNIDKDQLSRALIRRTFTVSPTPNGTVHFGLARAKIEKPQPKANDSVANAQIGVTSVLQQAIDQATTDSSY